MPSLIYDKIKFNMYNYLSKILVILNNFFQEVGFHPVIYHNRVYLYSQGEVNRFLKVVNTNNEKNKIRSER